MLQSTIAAVRYRTRYAAPAPCQLPVTLVDDGEWLHVAVDHCPPFHRIRRVPTRTCEEYRDQCVMALIYAVEQSALFGDGAPPFERSTWRLTGSPAPHDRHRTSLVDEWTLHIYPDPRSIARDHS